MGHSNGETLDFKLLFEGSPNLYMVLNPTFHIVGASDNYLKATMVRREQVIGRYIFDIFPDNPDDIQANSTQNLKTSLERVLQTKATDLMMIQKYDVRRPESEGGAFETRYWSPINTPIFNDAGEILYILHKVEDVTETVLLKQDRINQFKETEELRTENMRLEKSRQSQRLEAMGALAGGVAHDFNNILSIITLTSENARKMKNLDSSVEKQFAQIALAAQRAATQTRQLLAFSRQQVFKPEVINLNEILTQLNPLLESLLTEIIDIEHVMDPNLKSIYADQTQIEQIILNLAVNAKEAMPRGGKIKIQTSTVAFDSPMSSENLTLEPGSYIKLTVQDTGIGMDAKTKARIFEPFFTTKDETGTGLGLASVYGVVNQNNGSIGVYTEPNQGSKFEIYLPEAQVVKNQVIKKTLKETKNFDLKHLKILIVEDQDILRELICEMLEEKGATLYNSENGKAALDLLSKINYEVDLIVTDIVMPVMGGQALGNRLSALGSKIKILYISGFAADMPISQTENSDLQFLEKPFDQRTLLEKIVFMTSNSKH